MIRIFIGRCSGGYDVLVTRDGRRVAHTITLTRWGARRWALRQVDPTDIYDVTFY